MRVIHSWRLVGAIMAVVFVVWPLLPGRTRLTQKDFDRIRVGMEKSQVEAILGCPPGVYTGRQFFPYEGRVHDASTRWIWYGDEVDIIVRAKPDGEGIERAAYVDIHRVPNGSFLAKIGERVIACILASIFLFCRWRLLRAMRQDWYKNLATKWAEREYV